MKTATADPSCSPSYSRLYTEFLKHAPATNGFYTQFINTVGDEKNVQNSTQTTDRERYKLVARVLEKQNRAWGASDATLQNISLLGKGAEAVVTGQQAGLFGGPLFTILKAISAIKVARLRAEVGRPTVPVFWIATTDHDLDEVSSVKMPDGSGNIQTLTHQASAARNTPVSAVKLTDQVRQLVAQVREHFGGDAVDLIERCYVPGVTFGDAFARMMSTFFADQGLILLDPSDPELNRIAAPIYRQAIEKSEELNHALKARSRELEQAGYHAQVLVDDSSSMVFHLHDGIRSVVQRANGGFKIDGAICTRAELLARFDAEPEQFNANALLRPVVQDYLLPTAAYIGGPAEVAYLAQSAVLYDRLLGRMPVAMSRAG